MRPLQSPSRLPSASLRRSVLSVCWGLLVLCCSPVGTALAQSVQLDAPSSSRRLELPAAASPSAPQPDLQTAEPSVVEPDSDDLSPTKETDQAEDEDSPDLSDIDQDDDANEDEDAVKATTSDRGFGTFSTNTRNLRVNLTPAADVVPADNYRELLASEKENWQTVPPEKLFAWAAPDIHYQSLYFEDVALERYGQTPGGARQTLLSGIHFFTSAALLPYTVTQDRPRDCDWPLGFCRPGNDTPFTWQSPLLPLKR